MKTISNLRKFWEKMFLYAQMKEDLWNYRSKVKGKIFSHYILKFMKTPNLFKFNSSTNVFRKLDKIEFKMYQKLEINFKKRSKLNYE